MPSVLHVPDSFEVLRQLPDKSFDVTITDPPYDEHCQANQSSGTMMKELLTGKRSGGIPKKKLAFDALTGYAFIGDLLRLTRRWVVAFCTVEAFGLVKQLYPEEYVRGCIWYKPNSMGQLTKDRPATSFEGIMLLHPLQPKKRWNGKGSYGIWQCNGTRGEKGRHPNQKPLPLCRKLVALFSDKGETVFDPFCGSGRIGEACVDLGREYLGLDNDLAWVEQAAQAIAFDECPITDDEALSLCRMNNQTEKEQHYE